MATHTEPQPHPRTGTIGGLPPFAVARRGAGPGGAATGTAGSISVLRETILLIVIAAAVAIAMKAFVAQAFYIPSESMVPQLRIHDRIVVSKLAYHLHEPRRGDIVVFDCPPEARGCKTPVHRVLPLRLVHDVGEAVGLLQPDRDEYIKRVIGLPGETVEGHDGHVYVNGRQLVEPYLPNGLETEDFPKTTVPKGRLWVMGDNRPDSEDSRYFGPIRRGKIVGRTVFKIWPPQRAEFL